MSSRTRWILAALVCVPVVAAIVKWKWTEIDTAYQDWYYPAPQSPAVTPLGEEILRQRDSADMNRYLREYHRIEEQVAEEQRRGVDVGVYVGRLKDSTILARQGAFREAMSMLNLVEMGLPKPRQPVRPAPPGSDETEGPIEGRPVRSH